MAGEEDPVGRLRTRVASIAIAYVGAVLVGQLITIEQTLGMRW